MRNFLLICMGCLSLFGCQSKLSTPTQEKKIIPVLAVYPHVKDITRSIEAMGTFHPAINLEIYPQINGTIANILVSEGTWVEKGTPLIKIDDRLYALKVEELEAQVSIDRVELEAAQKKMERFKILAEKDLIAQAEWDEIVSHVDKAQSHLNLSEARLKAIRMDVENCTLYAPIQGRVGKLHAHLGQLVSGSTSLGTISQMDPLIIEFTVTEREVSKIPKENATIEVFALCGSSFTQPCAIGKVTFLDNHFDSKTGQLLVRGKVQNPNFNFRPGQIVKLKIPTSVISNALLIPQKAIRYNEEGTYVYIVNAEHKVEQRQIQLGNEIDKDVIVTEGLKADEQVIVDGHLRATPGSLVEVQL